MLVFVSKKSFMGNIHKQIFKGDGALVFKCFEAVLKNIINALSQNIGSFIDYEGIISKIDHSCAEHLISKIVNVAKFYT